MKKKFLKYNNLYILIILMLLSLVLLTGCSQAPADDQTSTVTAKVPSFDQEDANEMIVEEDSKDSMDDIPNDLINIKEFSITAKQWEWEPSVITVNEGEIVKLTITSEDVTHGIKLSEFGISKNFKSGETVNVEFVADKKGTFSFFCSVPCGSGHREMKGTLIVK